MSYLILVLPHELVAILTLIPIVVLLISAYLYGKYDIPLLTWIFTNFDRPSKYTGQGAITFFIGCLLAILLFNTLFAVVSVLVLSIGDGIAGIIGHYVGKHTLFKTKTLEGTAAFFVVTFLILIFVSPPFQAFYLTIILSVVELITPKYIDDNITIPVVTGMLLTYVSG